MVIGYDRELYILAMDHRTSFERMLGVSGREPTRDPRQVVSDAKRLIWEGFQSACEQGAPADAAGVLIDAQYGSEVTRHARARAGSRLPMPVEKSGQREFGFEDGDRFGTTIEEFDPTFSKVLVRYNPEGDGDLNRRQTERLTVFSDWLHERERKFMFELLIPPEAHQLQTAGRDIERYDEELRSTLMMHAIAEVQDRGIEPDVWKIEGITDRAACRRIAELVRRGGRDAVACVVLGRGADHAKVDAWLRAAAGIPGYIGFAIGRSIFGEALSAFALRGDRDSAIDSVARNYLRFIDVYSGATALA